MPKPTVLRTMNEAERYSNVLCTAHYWYTQQESCIMYPFSSTVVIIFRACNKEDESRNP